MPPPGDYVPQTPPGAAPGAPPPWAGPGPLPPGAVPGGPPPGAPPGAPPAPAAKPLRAEEVIQAIAGGAGDAWKLIFQMIVSSLKARLPLVIACVSIVWIVHTLLIIVVNDGFAKDSWVSPFLYASWGLFSSIFLYGFTSGLLFSFIFALPRMGFVGALAHLASRPKQWIDLVRRSDSRGTGVFLTGGGVALLVASLLLNSPACFAAGMGVTFLGMSRPGMLFVSLVSAMLQGTSKRLAAKGHGQLEETTKHARLFMGGTAPGFLVAAALLIFSLFDNVILTWFTRGICFMVGAIFVFAGLRAVKKVTAPPIPPPGVAGVLMIGTIATCLYAVFEYFFSSSAWAHDGGYSENGGLVGAVGSGGGVIAIGHGVPPAGATGIGAITPPLEDGEEPPPLPPPSEFTWNLSAAGSPGRLDAKPGSSFQISATVSTTDPKGNPAAVASTISFSPAGEAAAWFALVDETQSGATKTASFSMVDMDYGKEPPGPRSFRVGVSATAPTGGLSSSAGCVVQVGGALRIVHAFDGGKDAIVPDGKASTVLKARVVADNADGSQTPNEEATDSLQFAKGNDWLDISESVKWDATWRAITVQALNPDTARHAGAQPPPSCPISLTATAGEQNLSATAMVNLLGLPDLDVDLRPDRVDLAIGDKTPVKFRAIVSNPGEEPWKITTSLDDETYARVSENELSPSSSEISVTAPETKIESAKGAMVRTKLHIFARRGDEELERILPVVVAREGLQILSDGDSGEGYFLVKADKKKKHTRIPFMVLAKGPDGKLAPDKALVKTIEFSNVTEDTRSKNVWEVAQLQEKFETIRDDGAGYWKVWAEREIPGDENVHVQDFVATVAGKEGDDWSVEFKIGIKEAPFGPGSKEWRIEYDRCREVIRHVPEPHRTRLLSMVEERAKSFGAEGLFYLRKKIWRIAQELILAEGASGYENEAYWADKCMELAEWTKWICDMLFDACAGVAFGPVYGPVRTLCLSLGRGMLTEALVQYKEGLLPEHWDDFFKQQVLGVCLIPANVLTDPQALIQHWKVSPWKAWALAVIWQFNINYMVKGQSFTDSWLNAIRFCRDQLISKWLTLRVIKSPWYMDQHDVSSGRDQARFWSGGDGRKQADASGGKSVNQTARGQHAEKGAAFEGLEWDEAMKHVWEETSRRYAQKASGRVKVYNARHGTEGESQTVWNRVERPTLMQNGSVTHIEIYIPDGAGGWKLQQTISKYGGS